MKKEMLKIVTEKGEPGKVSYLIPPPDGRKIILTKKRSSKTKIRDVMKDCLIG